MYRDDIEALRARADELEGRIAEMEGRIEGLRRSLTEKHETMDELRRRVRYRRVRGLVEPE